MAEIKSIREVAAELGISYRACWDAVRKGRLPAVQPFGPGTTIIVPGNYQDILFKGSGAADGDNNNNGTTLNKVVV